MRLLAPCAFLSALAALPAAQTVVTVDDDLAADFSSLAQAVAAAPEGATVLVRAGAYDAFEAEDKALTIIVEEGAFAFAFGTSAVRNLSAGKTFVLRGLTLTRNNSTEVLAVEGCAGTVWLEDVAVETTGIASFQPAPGCVRVENSTVVWARGSIEVLSVSDPASVPPAGLFASGSSLHLFETSVTGGLGGHSITASGPGGPAVVLAGGFLLAAGATLQGGRGGTAGTMLFGCTGQTSGAGGPGLVVDAGADAHALGGTLAGGAGGNAFGDCTVGPAGAPSLVPDGALNAVLWPAHGLEIASPVHAGEPATASFHGVAGEFAWFLFADQAGALFLPQVLGTLVLDLSSLGIVPVGFLDGAGTAQTGLLAPIAPGASAQRFLVQSLFLDPGSNAFTLSAPSALVVLAPGI